VLDKNHPSWADFEPVLNNWICWWFHMMTREDVYLNIVVVQMQFITIGHMFLHSSCCNTELSPSYSWKAYCYHKKMA
jgi:hypothetical protein